MKIILINILALFFIGCSAAHVKDSQVDEKRYTIVAEIFGRGSEQLSNEMCQDLKLKGFQDAFVENIDGYFFVCVGLYKSKTSNRALQIRTKLKLYRYKDWGNGERIFILIKDNKTINKKDQLNKNEAERLNKLPSNC